MSRYSWKEVAMPKDSRACLMCGKAFEARKAEIFCSTECGMSFRAENRKPPQAGDAASTHGRYCSRCGTLREAVEWGSASWACKACVAANMRDRRKRAGPDPGQSRDRRLELKVRCAKHLGSKCIRCGFSPRSDVEYAAFDFHHRDPMTKSFGVAGSHSRSWESLVAELEKCDLLCANCHRILHVTEASDGLRAKHKAGVDRARTKRRKGESPA